MPLKLYWNVLSTPSRLVHHFCIASGIEVELVNIDLMAGEQKGRAFLEINPDGKVPAIDDDGFTMGESFAIIRYLANKHRSPLFPIGQAEPQAKVDMVTEVVKHTILLPAISLMYNKVIAVALGKPRDTQSIQSGEQALNRALASLESVYFKTDPNYVIGSSTTLADVALASAVTALMLAELDVTPYPHISAWYAHMETTDPFKVAHGPVFAAAAKLTNK